jgi:mono/diheme cytochrome c family protein
VILQYLNFFPCKLKLSKQQRRTDVGLKSKIYQNRKPDKWAPSSTGLIFALISGLFLSSNLWAAGTETLDPILVNKGQKLFKTDCAICHGPKGDGNGSSAISLNPKPRNFLKDKFKFGESLGEIQKTIGDGVPKSAMPSWKESLGDTDIQALATYVKFLRSTATGFSGEPSKASHKKIIKKKKEVSK